MAADGVQLEIRQRLRTAAYSDVRSDVLEFRDVDLPKGESARTIGFLDNAPLAAYTVQEKLDGIMLIHLGRHTYSKGGVLVQAPPFFAQNAFTPVPMIGELYAGPRQQPVTAGLRALGQGNEETAMQAWRYHRYVVYDIPGLGHTPYYERLHLLREFVTRWNRELLEQQLVVLPPASGTRVVADLLPLQCINAYPAHTHWRRLFAEVMQQPAERELPPWGEVGRRPLFDSAAVERHAPEPDRDVPPGEGIMFYRLDSPWTGRLGHTFGTTPASVPRREDVAGDVAGNIGRGTVGGAAQHRTPALVKCKPHLVGAGIVVGAPAAIVLRSEQWRPPAVDRSGHRLLRVSAAERAAGGLVSNTRAGGDGGQDGGDGGGGHYEGYTIPVHWLHPTRWREVVLRVYVPMRTDMQRVLLEYLQLGRTLPFYFVAQEGALGTPQHPVALLGNHPFGPVHIRAILRVLRAQDEPLPQLQRRVAELQREVVRTAGRLDVNGVLRQTVLPLYPPCRWAWTRPLVVRARRRRAFLLPPLYVEAMCPPGTVTDRWRIQPVPRRRQLLRPRNDDGGPDRSLRATIERATRTVAVPVPNDDDPRRCSHLVVLQAVRSVVQATRVCQMFVLTVYTLRVRRCLNALACSTVCVGGSDGLAFRRMAQVDNRADGMLQRWVDIRSHTLARQVVRNSDARAWRDLAASAVPQALPVVLSCAAFCWLAVNERMPDVLDLEPARFESLVLLPDEEAQTTGGNRSVHTYDFGRIFRIVEQAMGEAQQKWNAVRPDAWPDERPGTADVVLLCIMQLLFADPGKPLPPAPTPDEPLPVRPMETVVEEVVQYLTRHVVRRDDTAPARPTTDVARRAADDESATNLGAQWESELDAAHRGGRLDPITLLPVPDVQLVHDTPASVRPALLSPDLHDVIDRARRAMSGRPL